MAQGGRVVPQEGSADVQPATTSTTSRRVVAVALVLFCVVAACVGTVASLPGVKHAVLPQGEASHGSIQQREKLLKSLDVAETSLMTINNIPSHLEVPSSVLEQAMLAERDTAFHVRQSVLSSVSHLLCQSRLALSVVQS